MPDQLPHIFFSGVTEDRDFKPLSGGPIKTLPMRERQPHGRKLLRQLERLRLDQEQIKQRRAALGLDADVGMTLAIEVRPKGILDVHKQLEWQREGIEVLSVVDSGTSEIVSVHVPEGRLAAFEKRVTEYLTKNSKKSGKPANAALITAVEAFRKAAFDELWTDPVQEPPAEDLPTWFQIWLRSPRGEAVGAVVRRFRENSRSFNIEVEPGYVPFPGRVVVAAHGTKRQLQNALDLLDLIAEVRGVQPTAEFFLSDLAPREQAEWVRELRERTEFDGGRNERAYVTLLDTGVNRGHPLLSPALEEQDMHAVNPEWQTADHEGHGTGMAGLILHGDLKQPLASGEANPIPHRLESVKILPPDGSNPPHLYGWVTQKAAGAVEGVAPDRKRLFATMTTSVGKQTGLPSEWSATIDRLSFGYEPLAEEVTLETLRPRLFVLSAGNVPWTDWANYPTSNNVAAVENPGQSWNALTVGAYTKLTQIDQTKWPGLRPIAPSGSLSPASTTSMTWSDAWPYKPDVVAEGGNGSFDRIQGVSVGPESVRLLTTSHDMVNSPLAETGDTSAAAAEVARLCALLSDRYPSYWPETIRGLVVHGASYTPYMRGTSPIVRTALHKRSLIRRFGYGAISVQESLFSDRSRPTIVLQERISPYKLDGRTIKLNQYNMHELPWPTEVLQNMGAAEVGMRVTLSYFVEPNPSQRGWQSKYRYQSHGLRFAVRGSTESEAQFGQRINKLEREAADDAAEHLEDPDSSDWFLGFKMRGKGSLHSDYWQGSAAKLAMKSHLAVYPVGGWWKDWQDSNRQDWAVRYALVVSLVVLGESTVDLYTPIFTQIQVPPIAVI